MAEYAVGGATAVLFYAEPTRTYDVDVFVLRPSQPAQTIVVLSDICQWAEQHGFAVDAEHIMIHGVPVQLLPAYNPLVEEAIRDARTHDYEGVPVRVASPEHLVTLALQAGGARRRERAWQLVQSGSVNREVLERLLRQHRIAAEIPTDV